MLEINNLNLEIKKKKYLENISFSVRKGEYFVILGPTGSGKTLLLESIAGFRKIGGEIKVNGADISKIPIEERNFGIVYQDFSLFPHLNVYENIAFSLKVKGKRNISEKIEWIASKLGIKNILAKSVLNLSGGEKQKVAVARTLVSEPVILFLDEPFASIDTAFRKKMYDFIKEIHREFHLTILQITHDFNEAIFLADRIAVLRNGKIEQIGTPAEIFKAPKTEFVASFVGTDNMIPLEYKNEIPYLEKIDIPITTLKERKKFAIIHSEEIIVSDKRLESSARFCLQGKIEKIIGQIFYSELTINSRQKFVVKITNSSLERMNLKIGSKVFISFKESSLVFI
jgi:molybdate/tungstate transport system ATP-binding protein